MTYKNFIIEYKAISKTGRTLRRGKIIAKNKMNSFHAKYSFEEYLKGEYKNFGWLVVDRCYEDDFFNKFLNPLNQNLFN